MNSSFKRDSRGGLPVTKGIRLLVLLVNAIVMSGCLEGRLDKRIEELHSQVATARAELSQSAAPYLVSNLDFKIDLSPKPILGLVHQFNLQSTSDRRLEFKATAREGYIERWWTDCPWRGEAEILVKLIDPRDVRFPTLAGFLQLGTIDNARWDATSGFVFDLDAFGGAAAAVYGEVDTCIAKGPVPVPLPVWAALVPGKKGGHSEFYPEEEGIRYRVKFDQEPVLIGGVNIWIAHIILPFTMKSEIATGVIRNVVGKQGSLKVPAINFQRDYEMAIRFGQASILGGGVRAGGKISVIWK